MVTTEKPRPPHKWLREAVRHHTDFGALVSQSGNPHLVFGEIAISYYDIMEIARACTPVETSDDGNLIFPEDDPNELSYRKKQAVYYNVVLDLLQRDTAAIMNITTVSVGQYVDGAFKQLAKKYLPECYSGH